MTKNIIEMAKEAGIRYETIEFYQQELTAFADLVAAKATAKEREATIKIIKETPFSNWFQADVIEAIRARGEQA
jgi:hypothetical protein